MGVASSCFSAPKYIKTFVKRALMPGLSQDVGITFLQCTGTVIAITLNTLRQHSLNAHVEKQNFANEDLP